MSVRKALEAVAGPPDPTSTPLGNSHQSIKARINRLKRKSLDIDNFSIYANVRNPFHRIFSIYSYRHSRGRYKNVNFKEFFYNEYVNGKVVASGPITPMILVDGKLPTNLRIIKLEDINAKWPSIISRHFGKRPMLKTLNSVDHPDPMQYFDAEMKKLVRERDSWTIRHFYPNA